jgi:arginine utilization regulatory protein
MRASGARGAKKTSLPKALREKEKNEIMRILQTTSGNISQSARMLGMSRQNLQYKIKRFNIPLEQIRSSSV